MDGDLAAWMGGTQRWIVDKFPGALEDLASDLKESGFTLATKSTLLATSARLLKVGKVALRDRAVEVQASSTGADLGLDQTCGRQAERAKKNKREQTSRSRAAGICGLSIGGPKAGSLYVSGL